MAAFGEWRGPLYPPYQTLERLLSGYHVLPLMTLSSRSDFEVLALMIRKICFVLFLGIAAVSCESEPKFALTPVTMDCDQSTCEVTFDVTNTSDGSLPLVYSISLNQNYIRDPNKSGMVVVGTADGSIDLAPSETKTVAVEVEVTEQPNGSKVLVFDSRTPKFVLKLLSS